MFHSPMDVSLSLSHRPPLSINIYWGEDEKNKEIMWLNQSVFPPMDESSCSFIFSPPFGGITILDICHLNRCVVVSHLIFNSLLI